MSGSWSNETTNLIIVEEDVSGFSGIFGYSPTVGAGNLVFSVAAVAGTDPYGNTYLAGVSTYGVTGATKFFAAMNQGSISMGRLADITDSGGIGFGFYSIAGVQRPAIVTVGPNGTNPTVFVLPDITGRAYLTDTAGTTRADLYLSGAALHTDLQGTAAPWQDPSPLGSGWATGPSAGTVQPVQYRLDALDNLVIVGAIHSTSATPAATAFTLPAAYRPAITQRVPGVSNAGGAATARYIEVNASGAVSVNANLTASGQDVYFQVCVPMGNIL